MTYFDINWLLFSKPGTNLFVVGVNYSHMNILADGIRTNLMLPTMKLQRQFISLRNGSTVRFVRSEDLDEKTRGISNVQVVFGDDIKGGIMKSVLVRPREYTYTRIAVATEDSKSFRTHVETEETIIAHICFLYQRSEGNQAHFYRISSAGELENVLIVDRLVKVNGGVVVEDE